MISAGSFHSIALTSTGEVYTWGCGGHGQLGVGGTMEGPPREERLPREIRGAFGEQRVIFVAAGGFQSAAIAEDTAAPRKIVETFDGPVEEVCCCSVEGECGHPWTAAV